MKLALPCIACGRELRQALDDASENQPYAATAFQSHGHYGSTSFDPADGRYLEINVCDACLVLHRGRVLEGRDRRPVEEEGEVVAWEDTRWRLVPWFPDNETIESVLAVARREFDLDPPEEEVNLP